MANAQDRYQIRQQQVIGNRLAWHFQSADEEYWADYWPDLTEDYYLRASQITQKQSIQAAVLAQELDRDGLHLEAGCGSGTWLRWLKDRGYVIEGVEYSESLVNQVRMVQPDLSVEIGNVLQIDRPDGFYDSYISFGVVEHRYEGPEPFLEEAFRVLKPAAKLIISVPNFGLIRQGKALLGLYNKGEFEITASFYQFAFRSSEITAILQNCGFSVQYMTYYTANRLLLEEVRLYRWLRKHRGSKFWRWLAEYVLGKVDGHMMLIVAIKQGQD